jgi:hypothetical protein
MTSKLDQLRNAFKRPENTEFTGNSNVFPFWNMNIGEQAVIRFLPDLNEDNPFGFMIEKATHNLEINGEVKKVPCLKMYGDDCPICKVSQAYYKEDNKDAGKKYWRKKTHIAQALVLEDPLPGDPETGENNEGKVRIIHLSWQLFGVIKEALEGGELDEVPYAYDGGCNFIIKKSKQGPHATYSLGSKFARKATDLSEDVVSAIQEEMVDLSTLLPKKPDIDKVEAMLEASLTGQHYGDGDDGNDGEDHPVSRTSKVQKPDNAKKEDSKQPEVDEDADAEADAILAQIMARRTKAAE